MTGATLVDRESPLDRLRKKYRYNIRQFIHVELKVKKLEIYQEEIVLDFARLHVSHAKDVMGSSAGVGKSATIAWCVLWFIFVFDHAQGVAISMTFDNLRDGLWKELSFWPNKSEILSQYFEMNQRRLFAKKHPKTWFVSARTFDKKMDRAECGRVLSGLHAENLLYCVDEAGGIYPEVGKSIEQGFGEEGGKFVRGIFAGNPMSKDSLLYKEFQDKSNFIIHVSSDPDDPKRSSRISKEWAAEQIRKFGRDDPWVQVFILAQFPDVAIASLLDESDIDLAMARPGTGLDLAGREMRLGVDTARFGPDSNVFFPRQGLLAHPYEMIRNARTPELFRKVVGMSEKYGTSQIFVDCTGGYGTGLADMMLESGFYPYEVVFSSKPVNERAYQNLRTEMYFKMAEWVKRGGVLPESVELKKDLMSVTYGFNRNSGKMQLEAKEQFRSRLKRSPDIADALALTFAIGENTEIRPNYDAHEEEEEEVSLYERGLDRVWR